MQRQLEAAGVQVERMKFSERSFANAQDDHVAFHQCPTPEDAIDAALNAISTLPSNQRIAVITAELATARDYIESQLQKEKRAWQIQLPKALAKFSAIQTALTILSQQGEKEWPLETLAMLSRSPHWGEAPQSFIQRAKFILRVRQLSLEKIECESLLTLVDAYPDWKKLFHRCIQKLERKKHDMSFWVTQWREILHDVFYIEEPRFSELLDALAQRFHAQLFSSREALAVLCQACQQTLIGDDVKQPSLVIAKPLDILSENFDHIFWLDVTQDMTIIPVPVNSLIDPRIQRDNYFWAQDPSFNENLSAECFDILQQRCKNLQLSFPQMRKDRAQQPARFFILNEQKSALSKKVFPSTINKKTFDQDLITPWTHLDIRGGSGALKSQRLCPMQAFAKYRLRAQALPQPELGLTAIERGIVTHRALQLIWQQRETQEALAKFFPALDRITTLALKEIPYIRRKQLPQALFHLEQKNLHNLLARWLAAELTRPPFKIHSLEQSVEVMFAEHRWHLRIDRIDELQDGRLLLIDYKTGSTSINACLPENFTEPQLPLYAVTQALKVDAIALAEFSAKNLRCTGLTREALSLGDLGALKVVDDWDMLKTDWQSLLTSLTDDFVHSQAVLKPLDGPATCQQCGLQSFCRVNSF